MSTITYKFRNAKSDFHTITFEGPVINVLDLKKGIISQSKFNVEDSARSADFDLVVANQQTGEEYRDNNTLIPRNTLVVIHRVPATSMKAAKLYEPLTNPVVPAFEVLKKSMVSTADSEFGSPVYGDKSGDKAKKNDVEIERSAMFHVQEANRPEMSKPVPGSGGFLTQPGPNYVCHRCGVAGHWIRNCPTNNDKNFVPVLKRVMVSTGLPSTAHSIPVEKPGSQKPQRIIVNGKVLLAEDIDLEEKNLVPTSFRCDLCKGLLRTATFVPCCKKSFCEECIRQHMLRGGFESKCPTCANVIGETDELQKNDTLQIRVEDFRKQQEAIRHQRKRIKVSTTKQVEKDEYIQKKSSVETKKPASEAKFTSFGAKLSTTLPLSCLNCHESGHVFKDCPKLQGDIKTIPEPPSLHPPPKRLHHKPPLFRTPHSIQNSLINSLSYPINPLLNLQSAMLTIGAHSFVDSMPLPNRDKIKIAAFFGPIREYRRKIRRKRLKLRRRSQPKHRRSRSSSRARTIKRRRHKRPRSKKIRKSRKKHYSSTRSRSHYSKRRYTPSRSPTPKHRRHSYSETTTPSRPTTKRKRYEHNRSPTPKRRLRRIRSYPTRSERVPTSPPPSDKWKMVQDSSSSSQDSPERRIRFRGTPSPSNSPVPLSHLSEVLRSPPPSSGSEEERKKINGKSDLAVNGKHRSTNNDKKTTSENRKHKISYSSGTRPTPNGKKRKQTLLSSVKKRKTILPSSVKKRKSSTSSVNKDVVINSDISQIKRKVSGGHRVVLKHDHLSRRRRIVTSRSNCSDVPIVFGPFLPRKKKPKLIKTMRQVIRKSS